jgi:hypothetical protein
MFERVPIATDLFATSSPAFDMALISGRLHELVRSRMGDDGARKVLVIPAVKR